MPRCKPFVEAHLGFTATAETRAQHVVAYVQAFPFPGHATAKSVPRAKLDQQAAAAGEPVLPSQFAEPKSLWEPERTKPAVESGD